MYITIEKYLYVYTFKDEKSSHGYLHNLLHLYILSNFSFYIINLLLYYSLVFNLLF
jgi:hypothetical protein